MKICNKNRFYLSQNVDKTFPNLQENEDSKNVHRTGKVIRECDDNGNSGEFKFLTHCVPVKDRHQGLLLILSEFRRIN